MRQNLVSRLNSSRKIYKHILIKLNIHPDILKDKSNKNYRLLASLIMMPRKILILTIMLS